MRARGVCGLLCGAHTGLPSKRSKSHENAGAAEVADAAQPPAAVPAPPPPRVEPTAEHFETEIYPALRQFLEGENFRPFQIEEWLRTVQVEVAKGAPDNLQEALRIVHEEAMGGAPLPDALKKFYAPPQPLLEQFVARAQRRGVVRAPRYNRQGLSEAAANRLADQANGLRETNASRVLGFTAAPSNNCLAHWDLTLLGDSFDASSPLGMQLTEWTMHHSLEGSRGGFVRPADVQVEMLMPPDFPARGPVFRVIAPRFLKTDALNLSLSHSMAEAPDERASLSMSRAMETNVGWHEEMTVSDIAAFLRAQLEYAQVDLEAGKDASLATVGGFWKSYVCVYPSVLGRPEHEHTGQISLPSSALELLFGSGGGGGGFGRRAMYGSMDAGLAQSGGPMTFELSSPGGRRSFSGVAEFTAEEGTAVVPQWMAANLGLRMGEELHVRRVHVPKGVYMKLQPHTARYAQVGDTKRMLEWVLRRYTAVAAGDTLVIEYRGEEHKFDILDTLPGRAIRLIDSDVAVDFAPPLSGEEVPKALSDSGAGLDNQSTSSGATGGDHGGDGGGSSAAAVVEVPQGVQLGAVQADPEGTEGVQWKRCPNCRRGITMAQFDRHTLMCARLMWYCELCNVAVEKRQQQSHIEQQHASVFCECGVELEARLVAAHKRDACSQRMCRCKFCHLGMPYRELWAHEKECGAKTEKCLQCGQFVRISEIDGHAAVCGVADVDSAPRFFGGGGGDWGAAAYRNNGDWAPPPAGRRPPRGDDYLLCPHCNEPCAQLDDLQVHLLVAHPELPQVDFGGDVAVAPADPAPVAESDAPAPASGFHFEPPAFE